jgi:hypothetical protein
MVRRKSTETDTKGARISSRFTTGTVAMFGDGVATMEPTVEQTGQM